LDGTNIAKFAISFQRLLAAMSFVHAEPLPGQLPSLAAARPEAYTALIDCCLRMPSMPPHLMLVPGPLLLHAFTAAVRGSQATLGNTAAIASLASALTSLVKRVVQLIRAAADLQSQPVAAAVGDADAVAAYFPAAAPNIASDCVDRAARLLTGWSGGLESGEGGAGNAAGSSSGQAAASAALLAVVLARSLVQLADAMEAAGPEVFFTPLLGEPGFPMRWLNEPEGAGDAFTVRTLLPWGGEDPHNAVVQWQVWQLAVLQVMQRLWAAFKSVGIAPLAASELPAASAASTSAAAASSEALADDACADPQERSDSSSSSSNSSGSQQVKWGYLLRLQQHRPQWAAAVAAYEAKQPNWEDVRAMVLPSTAVAAEQLSQQFAEAIGLCRALAAAAPLPVVCNNPSCGNTKRVSEAAAACKACAGCRCSYCSVDCQKADWKRHKGACRSMADAGEACV
jgi:hypothetical protein